MKEALKGFGLGTLWTIAAGVLPVAAGTAVGKHFGDSAVGTQFGYLIGGTAFFGGLGIKAGLETIHGGILSSERSFPGFTRGALCGAFIALAVHVHDLKNNPPVIAKSEPAIAAMRIS